MLQSPEPFIHELEVGQGIFFHVFFHASLPNFACTGSYFVPLPEAGKGVQVW